MNCGDSETCGLAVGGGADLWRCAGAVVLLAPGCPVSAGAVDGRMKLKLGKGRCEGSTRFPDADLAVAAVAFDGNASSRPAAAADAQPAASTALAGAARNTRERRFIRGIGTTGAIPGQDGQRTWVPGSGGLPFVVEPSASSPQQYRGENPGEQAAQVPLPRDVHRVDG